MAVEIEKIAEAIDRVLETEVAKPEAAQPTDEGSSVIEAIDLHFSVLEKIDNLPLQEAETLGAGIDLYAHFFIRGLIEAWDPNSPLGTVQHVAKDPEYRKGYKAGWKSAHGPNASQVNQQHIQQLAATHGSAYAQGYSHGHQISGAAHHVVNTYHQGDAQAANMVAMRHVVAPHMHHLLTAYGHNPQMPQPERGDKFAKQAYNKNLAALDRAGDTVGDWGEREMEPEGGGVARTGAVRDIEKAVTNIDQKVNDPNDNPDDTTHEHHPADFGESLRRLVRSHGSGRGEEVVQFGKEGRPDKGKLQKVAQHKGLVTGGRRGRAGAAMRGHGDEAPEGVEAAGGHEYAPGEGGEEHEPETPEELAARQEKQQSEKQKQLDKAKTLQAGFGAEDQKAREGRAADERRRGEELAKRRAARVGAPQAPVQAQAPKPEPKPEEKPASKPPEPPAEKKPEASQPASPAEPTKKPEGEPHQGATAQDPEHDTFKREVEKHITDNPAFSENYQGLNVKQALKDMLSHPKGFLGRGSQSAAFAKQGLNTHSQKGHPHTNEIWRARKRIEGVFGDHPMWKKYHGKKREESEDTSIFDALVEDSSIFHGIAEDDVVDGGAGGEDGDDGLEDQPEPIRGEGDEDYADKKNNAESIFDRFTKPSIFDEFLN